MSDKLKQQTARLRADHERAVQLCLQHSLSTGHADTADQLMGEVIVQVQELREQRDTARAEVKRRGEMLRRCLPSLERSRRESGLWGDNTTYNDYDKLCGEIEALTDE